VATNQPPIQYKGAELDPERGPGLGCFRFQLIVLGVLLVLTPLSVAWRWPEWISAAFLIIVLVLLLVAGQTVIFLLRLVAADRRTRRRPLRSATPTVGELEDASGDGARDDVAEHATAGADPPRDERADASEESPPGREGPVRQ
jgi:hypothetical protein